MTSHNLRERAKAIAATTQCNCDLDRWQPEPTTGHSHVCRIHKMACAESRRDMTRDYQQSLRDKWFDK